MPIALEFKRCVPVGKELGEEERKGNGAGSQRDRTGVGPSSEGFYLFLAGGNVRGGFSGKGFSRLFISSPGVPFQGHGLHPLVSSRVGGARRGGH